MPKLSSIVNHKTYRGFAKWATTNKKLSLSVLLLILVVGFAGFSALSSRQDPTTRFDGAMYTPYDCESNEVAVEEDCSSVAEATTDDMASVCNFELQNDVNSNCPEQGILGDSTIAPMAWPIKKENWPALKIDNRGTTATTDDRVLSPIVNCNLLYGKDDYKTVSTGIEIAAAAGTPVYAAAAGQVVYAQAGKATIIVKTNIKEGDKTIYYAYHYLSERYVEIGATVTQNQLVGRSGSGGASAEVPNSIHFGVWITGDYIGGRPLLHSAAGKTLLEKMRHPMNYVPIDGRVIQGCRDRSQEANPADRIYKLPVSTAGSVPTPAPAAKVDKLLVFVEENHSLNQAKAGMPYAMSLANKYSYATNFTGITHPSMPNYFAIAAGSTFGAKANGTPSGYKLTGPSVFGKAIAANKTAVIYAEGMTSNCAQSNGGSKYAVRHNPWAYFVNERALCQKYDVPFTKFDAAVSGGKLPNVGMVVPNTCNDAHDCSLKVADNWFKAQMAKVFAGPDWKSGRLAVVLTFDEDNRKSGNKVLAVVIHPSQKGKIITQKLSLYSLSRLYSDVTGTTPLNNAKSAPSMSKAFGLPLASNK